MTNNIPTLEKKNEDYLDELAEQGLTAGDVNYNPPTPQEQKKQSWEDDIRADLAKFPLPLTNFTEALITKIKSILLQSQKDWSERVVENVDRVLQEERQFVLNILDGIDVADAQMQNKGGGTLAIRLALKTRILPTAQSIIRNIK